MRQRRLGKTELKVSEIGFGAWAIGGTGYGPVRDEDSLGALEAAWANGINFYDSADSYGNGHSETLLGRFLKGKPRGEIVIATKGGHDFYHGAVKKDFTPAHLQFACEQSLKRLGTDHIDLYQLHTPSLEVLRGGEAVDALEKLQKAGKIRFIGVSVYAENEAMAVFQDPRIAALQVVFNLLDQRMGRVVFPDARRHDVGLIVREPLACGLLTGKYNVRSKFEKTDHRSGWPPEKLELDLKKIEMLGRVLATRRISMARSALEYILEHDTISTVIPGIKTADQVEENIQASLDPRLRSQESSHLRDMYMREPVFEEGLD